MIKAREWKKDGSAKKLEKSTTRTCVATSGGGAFRQEAKINFRHSIHRDVGEDSTHLINILIPLFDATDLITFLRRLVNHRVEGRRGTERKRKSPYAKS